MVGKRKASTLLATQTARLIRLDRRLRYCTVTFDELLRELCISPATLKRDLTALREELGAPLCWDAVQRGYRYVKPWAGVVSALMDEAAAA